MALTSKQKAMIVRSALAALAPTIMAIAYLIYVMKS